MANQSDKEAIIRHIYYDADHGFGSILSTYQQAKKVLNSITLDDVKGFLSKQKTRQKKDYTTFNSYVADEPLREIQIDIADFTKNAQYNDGFRYMLVGIDVFTKIAHGVAMKTKTIEDNVNAFSEILHKIGIPKQIYTDNEGAWSSNEFVRLLNQHSIKHIITTSPPPFVERVIQTLKNMIITRVEGLDMKHEQWVDMLPTVLNKYNNTVHSTTNETPNNAKKQDNRIKIFLHIRNKSQYNLRYPKIEVGDLVRTRIKPHSFKKGYHSAWSDDVYKVVYIQDGMYMLNDQHVRRRAWVRSDLLKIPASEGKDG